MEPKNEKTKIKKFFDGCDINKWSKELKRQTYIHCQVCGYDSNSSETESIVHLLNAAYCEGYNEAIKRAL